MAETDQGRFRFTFKDQKVIKVLNGLSRFHRAAFVEIAVNQLLDTQSGVNTLRVFNTHSGTNAEDSDSVDPTDNMDYEEEQTDSIDLDRMVEGF